ncbi:MAG: diguanylate cyclase, partial [Gammaproteobacteria bacterium]|nr:diguanylate cyclase [Gammaproteobacteria bacterium]
MSPKPQNSSDKDFHLSLLRAYIDSANDGIFVVCDEMKFHVANRLLASWLDKTEATLSAHKQRLSIMQFLGDDESRRRFAENFRKTLAGQPTRFECRLGAKSGEPRWVEISLNKVLVEAGDLVIGVVRDITEHRQMLEQAHHYARHDDLTGLVNRREFEQRLNRLFESAKTRNMQHALLYVDLDQFKIVNDTCGHMAGDELLRQLAAQARDQIRKHDTFARLGGDEFGVLIENCQADQVLDIAEKLRRAISGFRFGACAITAESESPASILSNADAACYVAKDNGRNRVQLFYGGHECTRKRTEMDWVARLNAAIRENRLRLYYQKIVPVGATKPGGEHFEVLLRLIDEAENVVVPGMFLPAAEKYNLMPTIDRWVVRHLLYGNDEFHRRLAGGGSVTCSINLSGASLNDENFPAFLRDQITAGHVPPQALCFEITETVAIANLPRATAFMRQLAAQARDQIRKHDTFARLGGDEFGVLIENCQADQVLD